LIMDLDRGKTPIAALPCGLAEPLRQISRCLIKSDLKLIWW